jgi:hypothetical protein
VDKRIALILLVALDMPLRRVFDYLPPVQAASAIESAPPRAGVRVRVPFGRRQLIGILVGVAVESRIATERLKPVLDILDQEPVFDPVTFELLRWAAEYYHHPIGEVFAAALPASLREGQATHAHAQVWEMTAAGRLEAMTPSDRRAPQQRALLAWLMERGSQTIDEISVYFKVVHVRSAAARGWLASAEKPTEPPASGPLMQGGAGASDSVLTVDPNRGRRCDRPIAVSVWRVSIVRRHRQRQDRGLPARHRTSDWRRRTSARVGPGNCPDAAARGSISAPLRDRPRGTALGTRRIAAA